jgi:integrase
MTTYSTPALDAAALGRRPSRLRPALPRNETLAQLRRDPRVAQPAAPRGQPGLVARLREHITEYGTAADGRAFHPGTGGTYSSPAHSYVWQEVRKPAPARPYDLRHAAVSLWLNAGVPAVEVARRAGPSVERNAWTASKSTSMARSTRL